jgi:hypothetical protein
VGPSAGLDSEARGAINMFLPLPGIEPRSPVRPVRSQTLYQAVPWLRRLVAGLPPWSPGFAPESIHVGFVVDK